MTLPINLPQTLPAAIEEIRRLLTQAGDISFDIETTGLALSDHIVTIALKPSGRRAMVLDTRERTPQELRLLLAGVFATREVTLVGHNLYFDVQKLMHAGIYPRGVHFYDTMLAEYLIYGVGRAEALAQKLPMGLLDVGQRYGVEVKKEARNWFIGLDTRVEGAELHEVGRHMVEVPCTDDLLEAAKAISAAVMLMGQGESSPEVGDFPEQEGPCYQEQPIYESRGGWRPWDLPLPQEQLEYIRQDVVVPHRLKASQAPQIAEKHLEEVVALEGRVIPASAMMRVWGVKIDRQKWRAVLALAEAEIVRLEETLHEALDTPILAAREQRHSPLQETWQTWNATREEFLLATHAQWELAAGDSGEASKLYTNEDGSACHNWSQYKKAALSWYDARHERVKRPPALKAGVNLGSPAQVLDGLQGYGRQQMEEAIRRGDATAYRVAEKLTLLPGVSEEVLSPLAALSSVVRDFIDYQGARKIVVAYGENFLERLDAEDRIHADYAQLGTGTGRFSSYNGSTKDGANFQQMPGRGLGAQFREAVVAADGYSLVDADYSNIELRITADKSGDPNLLAAFASGVDVHAQTSVIMFDLHLPEGVDSKVWTSTHNAVVGGQELANTPMRGVGKTINFMALYGGGVKRLAAILRISEVQAKGLMQIYWRTFAVALAWIKEQGKREYAVTASGRRRYIPLPFPPHCKAQPTQSDLEEYHIAYEEYRRQLAGRERSLANSPIQGTSADIIKLALALLYERIAKAGLWNVIHIVAAVHDEILVEASNAVIPDTEGYTYAMLARDWLKWAMEESQAHYLKRVTLGSIEPTITSFWHHE